MGEDYITACEPGDADDELLDTLPVNIRFSSRLFLIHQNALM